MSIYVHVSYDDSSRSVRRHGLHTYFKLVLNINTAGVARSPDRGTILSSGRLFSFINSVVEGEGLGTQTSRIM